MSDNPFKKALSEIENINAPEHDIPESTIIYVYGKDNCPYFNNPLYNRGEKRRTNCGHCASIMNPNNTFYFMKHPNVIYDVNQCLNNYHQWTPAQKEQYHNGMQDKVELLRREAEKAKRGR